jgi:endonuclease/exonuclease/phosphatase family metal-dependent hydrolase
MASLGLGDVFRAAHPLALPLLALAHAGDLARLGALLARELLAAPGGLALGWRGGQDLRAELKFVQTRAAICVLLREMMVIGAKVDFARGLPIVHLNLVGYDECAHRRGPRSALAERALRDTDAAIARLARAARRSARRDYELWIMADHGQEPTVSYVERHGRSVQEAAFEVLRAHGLEARGPGEPVGGEQTQRARLLGERLVGLLVPGLDVSTRWHAPGGLTVTAQGSLGHLYAPRPLSAGERDAIARDLVARAHVPLVLAADGPGRARAWTAGGALTLPEDAARLLGADHPYLADATRDLVELCHHPDAGDLALSGWQPGPASVSFPHESGAHAGPGPEETDAFVVAPADAPIEPPAQGPLRPLQLRDAALRVLGRAPALPRAPAGAPRAGGGRVRLVTYNVHGCVGLDGRLSPERIARVLARLAPDAVALQELDVGRERSRGVDQAALIASALSMELSFHPTFAVEEERFGDAVLSRLPLRLVKAGPLPRLAALEPRGALWVELDVGGRPLQLLNTHLSLHPVERGRQVAALLGPDWLGDPRAARDVVLCGDLNALPWFPSCRRLARRLRDCQVGREDPPRRTFGGRWPLGRIDHVFADPGLDVLHVEVPSDALAQVASDHLPLVVDVRLPGGA